MSIGIGFKIGQKCSVLKRLICLAFMVVMSAAVPAQSVFSEPAFVSLKLANQVQKFPLDTVWAGGPNMLYNAVSPDGNVLLVTSPSTATVYAFDTTNGKHLALIKVGKASKGIKISPDGNEAYVSNEGDNSISVIELSSFQVVATIKTGKMPHNVRFSANGKQAYVTLQGGEGLGVIDTKSRKVVRIIPIPGLQGPHNLDLSNDGKMAYVRDVSNHIAVLDLTSGVVKKIIEVGMGHAGIDVFPNGQYAATGAIADNVVTILDLSDLSVVKKINVGNGPHGVRASKDNRWLYVTVTADDKVVVIDAQSWEIVKEYKVGSFPFWIAVNDNP
ncbi:MAG: YncE family protein [Gammaproteobacteria bacterium]|nr:YncE family protein [Gammaproteobacteria bacterium]